ncbi:hypothetical protein OAA09_01085 [bacterium]|nr:hypothetical protein [bacterium]
MKYSLTIVTDKPNLWKDSDPIHPGLDVDFKTTQGRGVFGLKGDDGKWKAFMCYARTTRVPQDLEELIATTDLTGTVIVPYTVWSHEKGAGRTIVNKVIEYVCSGKAGPDVQRVVTLSPQTIMARKFHIRNNAKELQVNSETVNFEYEVKNEKRRSS